MVTIQLMTWLQVDGTLDYILNLQVVMPTNKPFTYSKLDTSFFYMYTKNQNLNPDTIYKNGQYGIVLESVRSADMLHIFSVAIVMYVVMSCYHV